jgi:hypothetical protein
MITLAVSIPQAAEYASAYDEQLIASTAEICAVSLTLAPDISRPTCVG